MNISEQINAIKKEENITNNKMAMDALILKELQKIYSILAKPKRSKTKNNSKEETKDI